MFLQVDFLMEINDYLEFIKTIYKHTVSCDRFIAVFKILFNVQIELIFHMNVF